MVRIFGLLIALVASVQTANAALLASWNFNTDASGTVTSGVNAPATDMSNFGPTASVSGVVYGNNGSRNAGNFWRTSLFNVQGADNVLAARGTSLSFTNTDARNPIQLDSLSFNAKNQNGITQRGVRVSVSLNGGAEQAIGDYVRTAATFSNSTGSLDGLTLRQGDTLTVFF